MLETRDLTVFYENAVAINELNIQVARGEIVGLIGSNSAGKTTLMNTISGLIIDMKTKEERKGGERITVFGQVMFDGMDITNMSPWDRAKKGITLSRERHPIFPESNVLENLKIAGYLRKKHELREQIDFVFNIFPVLALLRKRSAGLLSGGEQQMLAISMALILKPILLLLDEPLLGLSIAMQASLVEAIEDIKKETEVAMLIGEQYARPILPIIEHGYVIENGMLTLSGTGKELMENKEVQGAYFGI